MWRESGSSEDPGPPMLGRSANTLGVRIEVRGPRGRVDVHADGSGWLRRAEPAEGLSVQVDEPRGAPPMFLPPPLGDSNGTLYEIDERDLPELLVVVPDHDRHAVLAPRRDCTLDEYEDALAVTQPFWKVTDVARFPPVS